MYIVLVKHYLTIDGIGFFINEWFPKVHKIMSQQEGFISLTHESHQDYGDCVHVISKFKDLSTLELWGYSQEHDALVNALDTVRSKNYWEYAVIDNARAAINWQKVLVELG